LAFFDELLENELLELIFAAPPEQVIYLEEPNR